jgi:hypothetical protein
LDDKRDEPGDVICKTLIASNEHERGLRSEAAKQGITYESLAAAALASAILERCAITPRGNTDRG